MPTLAIDKGFLKDLVKLEKPVHNRGTEVFDKFEAADTDFGIERSSRETAECGRVVASCAGTLPPKQKLKRRHLNARGRSSSPGQRQRVPEWSRGCGPSEAPRWSPDATPSRCPPASST